MRIDAETGKSKLAHIGAADGDHARLLQRRHHICVAGSRRIVRQHRRSGSGCHAREIEKILPCHRNAIEYTTGAAFANTFRCRFRLRHGALRRQADKNRLVIVLIDRIERLLHQTTWIEMAALDENRKLRDVLAPVSHDIFPETGMLRTTCRLSAPWQGQLSPPCSRESTLKNT